MFKPGDIRLNIWLEHTVDVRCQVSPIVTLHVDYEYSQDQKYRVTAYDSIVTVVEPEISIYDFKLYVMITFHLLPLKSSLNDVFSSVSTYLIVAAFLGGLTYVAYLTFAPHSKKPRKSAASAPVSTPATPTTSGYQEEWIPEHHLKKPKSGRKQSGVVSSGDELSGGESEIKKRKGRK
jgi:hypothetical protein